jgi:CHAD domain-containing protein
MTKPEWDPNAKAYAASILVKHIQSLQAEMNGVRVNKDIEHIHRMRVASRRLRNALQIFGSLFPEKQLLHWSKSIKKITSSLGEARDKDVQILLVQKLLSESEDPKHGPGLKRVILRLKQKRDWLQKDVLLALDGLNATKDLDEIQNHFNNSSQFDIEQLPVSPVLFHLSWQTILPLLQELLNFEIFIDDPANARELHAMRISAKNMRYSLELFSPFYPDKLSSYLQAARLTQEKLGNVHDAFIWNQYLTGFIEKEKKRAINFYGIARGIHPLQSGIDYLINYQNREYIEQYQSFLLSWHEWQGINLWQELVNTLKSPLI